MKTKIIQSLSILNEDQLKELLLEVSQKSDDAGSIIRSFCTNRSELPLPSIEDICDKASDLIENINLSTTKKGLTYENYLKVLNLLYYFAQNWSEAYLNHKEYSKLLRALPILANLWDDFFPDPLILELDLPTYYDIGAFILQYIKRFLDFSSDKDHLEFFLQAFKNIPEIYALNDWFTEELISNFLPGNGRGKRGCKKKNYLKAYELFFNNDKNKAVVLNNLSLYEPLIIDYFALCYELNTDLNDINALYNHFSFIKNLKSKVEATRKLKKIPDKMMVSLSFLTDQEYDFSPDELIEAEFCKDLRALIEEYFYSGLFNKITEED